MQRFLRLAALLAALAAPAAQAQYYPPEMPEDNGPSYTALWWNPAESGWGLNTNHQDGTVFATLFTYAPDGEPMWLVGPNLALMPGQFVRLRMASTKAAPLLAVNERAIGTDQNKKFVMVVDKGNVAAYREVALGASVDGLRVVTSGLSAGERIIVNGLQRVRPGAVVAPEAVSMDGQSVSQAQEPTKAVLR